ncbi:sarcosine oxidase subunit gamma [Nakamurella flava]|uniref:Sarcosine oxidase subunit gamma n=1 Tax=Nakamurella flava TaxID=2576308 RepID=A0A4U6QAB7_9ACTN|nr:sarcosine oxidase subunit gamma family protein [Nakamurella flava]TKV56870.1 sarcosine oxidase subunit gamma [Nakamurella flava]
MADTLVAHHPLEFVVSELSAASGSAVTLTPEPFLPQHIVRLPAGSATAAVAAQLQLPTAANTWSRTADGRAIWLGPDEWLLVGSESTDAAASAARERELLDLVQTVGGAVTDVSAQRLGIRLGGPKARTVLAKGCSIDLHPKHFGIGTAVQTVLGQAGVVLLALPPGADGHPEYLVLVRSSFAGYLATWLLDAALEFTSSSSAAR